MAASDSDLRLDPLSAEGFTCLAAGALTDRLEEEIARAERHGTQLSCVLVVIENLEEVSREHGSELAEQMLTYVGAAMQRELRRFDRIGRPADAELMLVLPGADSTRSEMVARRLLERIRAIKVEADGRRYPLRFSLGLAPWRQDSSAEELLARARAATRSANGNGENASAGGPPPVPPARHQAGPAEPPDGGGSTFGGTSPS